MKKRKLEELKVEEIPKSKRLRKNDEKSMKVSETVVVDISRVRPMKTSERQEEKKTSKKRGKSGSKSA